MPEPREDQLRPNALDPGEFAGPVKALIPLVGAAYVDQGSAETIALRRGEFGEVFTCSVRRLIAYMPFRRSRLTRKDVRSLHRAKPARLSIAIAASQRGSGRVEEPEVIGAVSQSGNAKSPSGDVSDSQSYGVRARSYRHGSWCRSPTGGPQAASVIGRFTYACRGRTK